MYESNAITIYGKGISLFIRTSKGGKHYSIILIILIIIVAPRQLGNHPMQLELHNSALKILIFLPSDTSQPPRDSVKQIFVVVFS